MIDALNAQGTTVLQNALKLATLHQHTVSANYSDCEYFLLNLNLLIK